MLTPWPEIQMPIAPATPDDQNNASFTCPLDPHALRGYIAIADTLELPAEIAAYDLAHASLYAQLLDAADAGMEWKEGAARFLSRDPFADPEGAWLCWEQHVARARWIVDTGFPKLANACQQ
jgi:hypothetical protein